MKLEVISEAPANPAHATPILFVHGMWHAAWCWEDHFLPYFAQHGYSAHALSLRGHGGSEGRERLRWTPLSDYVADLTQVVDQMTTTPVLVGHSSGGMIIQKYLESHQAPAAVMLASAPTRGLGAATLRVARRHPWVFLKSLVTTRLYYHVATPELCQEKFFSKGVPAPEVEKCHARLRDESYRAYLDMMLPNLIRPGLVKTPMLVLGADTDSVISTREVEATAKAYGTSAEIFPGTAHDMMLDDNWQSVADRILGWLAELKI